MPDTYKNFDLLMELRREHRAEGFGSISGFFDTDPDWLCGACFRSKRQIARLDKNGNLLCAFHVHHDHFGDLAFNLLPRMPEIHWRDRLAYAVFSASFGRFQQELICGDCNAADGAAKAKVGAATDFSFSPFEISTFIIVEPNAPHQVNAELAGRAYDAAKPLMKLYGATLREAKKCLESDDFAPAGGAALSVLLDVRAKMKLATPEPTR
jgi:hypothetical protein